MKLNVDFGGDIYQFHIVDDEFDAIIVDCFDVID